ERADLWGQRITGSDLDPGLGVVAVLRQEHLIVGEGGVAEGNAIERPFDRDFRRAELLRDARGRPERGHPRLLEESGRHQRIVEARPSAMIWVVSVRSMRPLTRASAVGWLSVCWAVSSI